MKNKIAAIGTLSLLTLLSFGKNITNANADLTAPSGYTHAYKQDFTDYWRIENTLSSAYDNPIYTRTGASSPYDYTVTTNVELPMSVSMTFRKSNTPTWSSSGGGYRPGALFDDSIGSTTADNVIKLEFTFNNTTGGDTWLLYLDIPTVSATMTCDYTGTQSIDYVYSRVSGTTYIQVVILPYTNLNIYTASTTASREFDAWYLVPVNANTVAPNEYTFNQGFVAGYEDGYGDGVLAADSNVTARIGDLMKVVFSGVGGILNVKIFDELTLGSIMLFPLAMTLLFFIFKIIRGSK